MPARKFYLFDTCAAKHLYLKAQQPNIKPNLAYLMAQQLIGDAFFFIPVFCIAELFNVFAHMHYRDADLSKPDYDKHVNEFAQHVRNRATFYPLPLSRYHNYSADKILPIEHSTATEYEAAGIKAPVSIKVLKTALKTAGKNQTLSDYRLATFDILLISMGIELAKVHGQDLIAIITNDRRLALVANACHGVGAPKAFFIEDTPLADLQAFQAA